MDKGYSQEKAKMWGMMWHDGTKNLTMR